MTKEEQIIRLKRGIASEETPPHIKAQMEETLAELEKPEPDPQIAIDEAKRLADEKEAKDRERAEKKAKADEKEAKRLALNKKNVERRKAKEAAKKEEPPPPPPPRVFTAEEKERIKEDYKRRRERKKERSN